MEIPLLPYNLTVTQFCDHLFSMHHMGGQNKKWLGGGEGFNLLFVNDIIDK